MRYPVLYKIKCLSLIQQKIRESLNVNFSGSREKYFAWLSKYQSPLLCNTVTFPSFWLFHEKKTAESKINVRVKIGETRAALM